MGAFLRQSRNIALAAGVAVTGYVGITWLHGIERERLRVPLSASLSAEEKRKALEWRPPTRAQLISELKHSDREFDLLVIGGGATGTGCALEGATRGLKVALVERDDYSAGTSSKSTKLVHGGVRYLEKAFLHLDWEQFSMVREALAERATFLRIAPHLTDQLAIMVPIYRWWKIPYYWAGSKAYDFVAGGRGLESSYFLNQSRALQAFPMLRKDSLVGAMVYYDGSQNDARTNVSLALTAIYHGATVTNYTEVVELIKNESGKLSGVIVKDRISGEVFPVKCKGVISATGPFCGTFRSNVLIFVDLIRKLDDPNCKPLVQTSIGTHIMFPSYYSSGQMGLIDPSSSDGRVIFFLPWEGNTIAGTTDQPSKVTFEPKASQNEINFIVEEVKRYLDPAMHVKHSDVLAAWSGLRPLIRDPTTKSTQELVRSHIVMTSSSGLLTIAGGKWTTYRQMSEDAVNAAVKEFKLEPKYAKSRTDKTPLIGAHDYHHDTYVGLIQRFGLETDVAKHLASSYGDRSWLVGALCDPTGSCRWPLYGRRLVPQYPYLESEVVYACRFEYAQTAIDILARRTRLAHLSCFAAKDVLPKVVEIMSKELGWSKAECERQTHLAEQYLVTCGISDLHSFRAEFHQKQMERYRAAFNHGDKYWHRLSLRDAITGWKRVMEEEDLKTPIDWEEVVRRTDPDKIGSIGFSEFLDGISFIELKIRK